MRPLDLSALESGLVVAVSILLFFCVFSTALVSLAIHPDRLGETPRWFQSLSVIRRNQAARLYYAVATVVFVAMSLAIPVVTLFRWQQVAPGSQVAALISWPGIATWLVVLWGATRRARRR